VAWPLLLARDARDAQELGYWAFAALIMQRNAAAHKAALNDVEFVMGRFSA